MKLENAILLVKLLFLVLVYVCYLCKEFSSVFAHLELKLLFCSIETCIRYVFSLSILGRPFSLQVALQDVYKTIELTPRETSKIV